MDPANLLAVGWVWEPSVVLGLVGLQVGYLLVHRAGRLRFPTPGAHQRLRGLAFTAGTLAVAIALLSPLDRLADAFLFSAHMLQHLLLLLVAPLLWVLGLPPLLSGRLGPNRMGLLTQPGLAALVWSAVMWAWHSPPLFQAALRAEPVHILEHLMLLGAGAIGWWPAFGPRPGAGGRRPGLGVVLHLFAFSLSCTGLAAALTLSPTVLYPWYGRAPLALGLSPLSDQQLGGLLMWVPGDMLILGAAIVVLARWFGSRPESDRPPFAPVLEVP